MKQEYKYEGDELLLFSKAANWKKYISSKVQVYITGDVAEVGAGIGGFTPYLYTASVKSWTYIEPDIVHSRILQQKTGEGSLPAGTVINSQLSALSPDKMFDTILYMDVLEHIEDDINEVHTIIDHLNPGGHIIILSPAFQFLYTPFDKKIGHFRRYNKKQLKKLFSDQDGIRSCRYLDCLGSLASLANKFILKQSYPTAKQVRIWDKYILPVSKITDPVFQHVIGRSVLLIWQKGKNIKAC